MNDLNILEKNLKGTNWTNPRYADGRLIADHHGEMIFAIGNGRSQVYSGKTSCHIWPSERLFEKEYDYGFDQNGFVAQNMDWEPL